MEAGIVRIARAKNSLVFPAQFSLIAAMNPCPCGFFGDPEKECRCGAYEIIRYQRKISGPLLDRIDLQIKVSRVKIAELREIKQGEPTSPGIKKEVEHARKIQTERFAKMDNKTNACMSSKQTEEMAHLDSAAHKFLDT